MVGWSARSRHLRARAAFRGGRHAVRYGTTVLARRGSCQLPFGCHWCGPGVCRARRGLRSAHGCWAHRRALPRPTYLCLVSGDIMALPRENGPATRVEAFFTWSCCCNPCPLGTADPQRNARHWRGPELLGATQPQGCVPEVGSESSARRESRETAARRFGGAHGLPAGGCPPHRRFPT